MPAPVWCTRRWWEVEELIRKLVLSAVVVLFDAGSPLQVLDEHCNVVVVFP